MKKWIALLLAALMCLSLCACGGSSDSQSSDQKDEPSTESAETKENDAPKSKASDAQAAEFEDEAVLALAEQYLDFEHYSEKLTILDGVMDLTIKTVKVEDATIPFGASLEDLAGEEITPADSAYGNTDPNDTIRVAEFKTASGKSVSIGFYGDGAIKTTGRLTNIGTYAFGSSPDSVASVSVDRITIGTSIADVIAEYGEPDHMKQSFMLNEQVLQMEYYDTDGNQKLFVYVSPASAGVIGLTAQVLA